MKVYIKAKIPGTSTMLKEEFSVSNQHDAKKMMEARYGSGKYTIYTIEGPLSKPPGWF